jgi:hypothetical protein
VERRSLVIAACGSRTDGAELAAIRAELADIRAELRAMHEEQRGQRAAVGNAAASTAPQPPAADGTEPHAGAPTPAVSVQVESTPPGADVFVSDEKIGVTPVAVPNPTGGGELRVRLEKDGYRPHLMNLRPGESGTISVRLARKDG